MVKNVIEDVVVPESPKVIPNEQLHVFVPVASNKQKGIAKFNDGAFEVVDGEVKIKEKYLNDVSSKGFVAKSSLSNKIYGTDDAGEDVNISYSSEAAANNIVRRTNSGDVIVPSSTTNIEAAVSLTQLKEGLAEKVPVVKDDALDEKFLYSHFYDKYGKSRLVKADSELDSELAVRLRDGHIRVPYNPASRFTVDTAVNYKYLLDNYKTAKETEAADIYSFDIEQAKDENGKYIFGVYNFKITLNDGTTFTKPLDLPLEAVQIASVNDIMRDGERYLEITFADPVVDSILVKFDEIFNIDDLVKPEVHIGPNPPDTHDSVLWVDTDDGEGVGGSSQPYDVECTLSGGISESAYAKLTISDNWDDGVQHPYRLVIRYYQDDMIRVSDVCVFYSPCSDSSTRIECDMYRYAPTHWLGNTLYLPGINASEYTVFIKRLDGTCSGATVERVESVPESAYVIPKDSTWVPRKYVEYYANGVWQPRPITYTGGTKYAIVCRNSAAEVLVPEKSSYSNNAAVPYSYIKNTMLKDYATAEAVEDVTNRLDTLENLILNYDTYSWYGPRGVVPADSASKLSVSKISSVCAGVDVLENNKYSFYAYPSTVPKDGQMYATPIDPLYNASAAVRLSGYTGTINTYARYTVPGYYGSSIAWAVVQCEEIPTYTDVTAVACKIAPFGTFTFADLEEMREHPRVFSVPVGSNLEIRIGPAPTQSEVLGPFVITAHCKLFQSQSATSSYLAQRVETLLDGAVMASQDISSTKEILAQYPCVLGENYVDFDSGTFVKNSRLCKLSDIVDADQISVFSTEEFTQVGAYELIDPMTDTSLTKIYVCGYNNSNSMELGNCQHVYTHESVDGMEYENSEIYIYFEPGLSEQEAMDRALNLDIIVQLPEAEITNISDMLADITTPIVLDCMRNDEILLSRGTAYANNAVQQVTCDVILT